MEIETLSYDSEIFNSLQSNTNNSSLLSKFQQKHNDDHIIEKKLIKIIKLSAFKNGIENIAGKAMSILKKMTKTIRWENFQNIYLKDCSMRGISFIDCNFSGSRMENVKIDSCWFIGCCLDNVKWLNITCSEQKLIKVRNHVIQSLDCSQDGTQLICTTKNLNNKFIFHFYEFYSGKIINELSTIHIIEKVALLTKQIIAHINREKILRFCCIQNWKFKFSKYLRNVYNFFELSNGILIIQIKYREYTLQSFFKPKMLRKINFESCKQVCSNRRYFAYQDKNCIEFCDLIKAKTYKLNLNTKIEKELFFAPNNYEIAVRRWKNISFWNIQSLQMTKKVKLSCSKLEQLFKKPFSNDGQMLMTHNDGIINLHNFKAMEQFKSFCINENSNCQIGYFHPIKKIMITCFKNHIYYLDCFAKQKIIMEENENFSINQLTMSYNKEFFALLDTKNKIQIFRVKNGEQVKSLEDTNVTSIAFSPIDSMLIFGKEDSSIQFYDVQKNRKQKQIQTNMLYGKICKIVFSPKGSEMALAGLNTPDIIICNGKTGDQLYLLQDNETHKFIVHKQIQFSPNSQFLASGIQDIRLWNLEQRNQCTRILQDKYFDKVVFSFTPDNKHFAYYQNYAKIRFFNILLNTEVQEINIGSGPDLICFLNKGLYLLCCDRQKFQIYDVKTGKKIQSFNNGLNGNNMVYFDFSKNGIIFMGSDKGFSFWDVYNEKTNLQILVKDHEVPIKFLAFSQTNQLLISETEDGKMSIYKCQQECQLAKIDSIPDFTQISLVRLSKSGVLLSFVDSDQVIQIWNLQTLQLQNKLEFHKNKIQAIDIQDNDQQLLSCENNLIYLWDITQNKIVQIISSKLSEIDDIFFSPMVKKYIVYALKINQEILYQHTSIITCLKIFPNRKCFIIGSMDGKIFIFNLTSKTITKEFYDHEDQIIDISFSLFEYAFASVSKDETICFWKFQYDTLFEKINCIQGVNAITFMNRDCLAYGSSDGTIKTIQFLQQNIRPLNQFTNFPKCFKGY